MGFSRLSISNTLAEAAVGAIPSLAFLAPQLLPRARNPRARLRPLCSALLALALPLVILAPAPVRAQTAITLGFEGPVGEDGVPAPWVFRRWSPWTGFGSFEATAKVVQEAGKPVLYVRSLKSGFLVGVQRRFDVRQSPFVSWSWKAEKLPVGGDFRQRSTNDQALQVLFRFEGGNTLGYIWDGVGQPGAKGSGLTWQDDVRVIVLEAGTGRLGSWVAERRNLVEDYRMLFGGEPPIVEGAAVQSNSNHTETLGAGYVSAIVLSDK